MDLNAAKQNTQRIEKGAWVENIPDADDLRILTRGVNNEDWRELQTSLINALPAKKRRRGKIPANEMERITTECLLETCLLGWENLTLDKVPVPYSKEKARELLFNPDYRPLKEFCAFAAQVVADGDDEEKKELEGNSASASETT